MPYNYELIEHDQIVVFDPLDGPDQVQYIGIDAPLGMVWAGFFSMIYIKPDESGFNVGNGGFYDILDGGKTLVVTVSPLSFDAGGGGDGDTELPEEDDEPPEEPDPYVHTYEYSPKIVVKAAAVWDGLA